MRTEARGTSLNETATGDTGLVDRDESHRKPPSAAASVARYGVFAVLAAGGLVWDLWSKWSVFKQLDCPGFRPVWKGSLLGIPVQFDLATTFNHGALWGMGQGQTWLFASLSVVAIAVIAYFVWSRQAVSSWWLTIASGLLLAGTLGNLYDRLGLHGWKDARGHVYAVRDFLDFVFFNGAFHWATFNFADMYLVTGAIMLVVQSFWTPVDDGVKNSSAARPI
jgi:signal peptidase II